MKCGGLLLMLLLGLVGCQFLTGPEQPAVRVFTERSSFEIGPDEPSVVIPFVVQNRGGETVYLTACGGSVAAVPCTSRGDTGSVSA